MTINERLSPLEMKCRREELGLTHIELAETLGVRPDTVKRWESGRAAPIPPRVRETIETLEHDMETTIARLMQCARDGVISGPASTRHERQVLARARARIPGGATIHGEDLEAQALREQATREGVASHGNACDELPDLV